MGATIDLELGRAQRLLNNIRLDSLAAWLNRPELKNKQLKKDVKALPGAMAVVLDRLRRRMKTITELTRQRDRAREIGRELFHALDIEITNNVDGYEIEARMSDSCGTSWRVEVNTWPE